MVMLSFINKEIINDVNTPIKAFSDKSISNLLTHITDVYKFWLGEFCMNQPQTYTFDKGNAGIDLLYIYQLFADVDNLTAHFIARYTNSLNNVVSGTIRSGKPVDSTPLELFTHVVTHEFHHKGQIMNMCRLLGKVPPDTDIIRT